MVGATGYDNTFPGTENYTITFSTGGGGQLQYAITGSTSGAIGVAQDFVSGEDITFAGATINIGGEPKAGDTFAVTRRGHTKCF